ncbi:MAG: hypothetical protein ACRYFS_20610 [Janthinobacterium lividum]
MTDDDICCLEVAKSGREALVLCLTLGTLEAMRGGAWPLEAGIWTLGRPCFWESLTDVDAAVVEVLQSADELSAMAMLCGQPAAEAELDRMIGVVRSRLSVLSDKSWHAWWSDDAEV